MHQRFRLGLFAACLLLPLLTPPALADEADVLGEWQTHKGGHVEFYMCGDKLCGRVSKLARDDHDAPPTDINNPDPDMRDRPLLGLVMFKNYTSAGDGRWTDGEVYNVENGKTYRSKLALLPDDQLKLSGCIFIFCRSYTWNRAPGEGQ